MKNLLPDLHQAQAFLDTIAREPGALFGFRTCADHGDDPRLAVKAFGTLDRGIRQSSDPSKNGQLCRPVKLLTFMQGVRAGVFVAINGQDGNGQRRENTTDVRAFFADADSREQVGRLHAFIAAAGLTPTVLVASGGVHDGVEKLHCYWGIAGCPVAEFTNAQLTLVSRIGTDPAVQDVSRIMRLPGFWHLKRDPRQTRIISISDNKYDYGSFLARVKAQPQIVDPWAGGKGLARSTGRRGVSGSAAHPAGPTARLRVLLDASGGLLTPAVHALLREAVAPTDGQSGNRHSTLLAVVARLMQAGWPDSDVSTLVLPVINGEWGDGDWGEHLDRIIGWTRRQEAAAIAAVPAASRRLVAAFRAGGA